MPSFDDGASAAAAAERFLTAGFDIGSRTVKIALLAHGPGTSRVVAGEIVAVEGRRDARDTQVAVREGWARLLRNANLTASDVAHFASTGATARAPAHVGHFYRWLGLTAGIRFLFPGATAVLDIGARQMRCALLDPAAATRGYAATRRSVICGGEVLESIARGGGVAVGAAGRLPAARAAYDDLAAQAAKLMGRLPLDGPTVVIGALAGDFGFVQVLARRLREDQVLTTLLVSPDGIFAAAYGAALRAARRYTRKLAPETTLN